MQRLNIAFLLPRNAMQRLNIAFHLPRNAIFVLKLVILLAPLVHSL